MSRVTVSLDDATHSNVQFPVDEGVDEDGVNFVAVGRSRLSSVFITPDHNTLLAADTRGNVFHFDLQNALTDTTIRIYNTSTGDMIEPLIGHKRPIHSLDQDSHATCLLTASEDAAVMWSTSDWQKLKTLYPTSTSGPIVAATFMREVDYLCLAFADASIMVWNTTNMGRVAKLTLPEAEGPVQIQAIAGSQDGTLLVAGAANGCMYLWDIPTNTLLRIIDMPADSDGFKQLYIIHPSVAETLRVATGSTFPEPAEGSDDSNLTAPGLGAPQLIALDGSGRLLVVDLKPAQPATLLRIENVMQEGVITAFTVSEDGQTLAITSDIGVLVVYDLPTAIIHFLDATSSTGHGTSTNVSAVEDHTTEQQSTYGTNTTAEAGQAQQHEQEQEEVHGSEELEEQHLPSTLTSTDTDDEGGETLQTSQHTSEAHNTTHTSTAQYEQRGSAARASEATSFADSGDGQQRSQPFPSAPSSVSSKMRQVRIRPRKQESTQPLHEKLARVLVVPRLGPGADAYAVETAKRVTTATHGKLRALLNLHNTFPAEYRSLAWRFLLRLPSNVHAFDDLVARGTHSAWKSLSSVYALRDRRGSERLSTAVNAVSFWSPAFAELPCLPLMAFPFVKFFGSDQLVSFETIVTVLLNWCCSFVECLPHPPVPLLARVHILLSYWDAPLADHLERCGADPSRYAWPILRSLFSEVLVAEEWQTLWDHLFVDAHDPSMLIYALVAYLRYIRGILLAIKPSNPVQPHPGARQTAGCSPALPSGKLGFTGVQELAGFVTTPAVAEITAVVRNQNAIHLPSVLKMMKEMRKRTPVWAHPIQDVKQQPADVTPSPLRATGPTAPPPRYPEPQVSVVCGNVDEGPLVSLPQGAYPPFLKFPRAAVDYAIAERNRIAAEEDVIARKKALAELLSKRTAELVAEEEAWRLERKLVEAQEAKRAEEAEALTALREKESALAEAFIQSHRISNVASVQHAAQQALATQRARRSAVQSKVNAERVALARAREEMMRKRLNEEALLSMELKALDRVRELDEMRDDEEAEHFMQTAAAHKATAEQLRDQMLGEAWRLEDEERRVKRAAVVREAAKVKKEVTRSRMNAAGEMISLAAEMERQAAISDVERERRLRHSAEDAAMASHEIASAVLEADRHAASKALEEAKWEVERFQHTAEENRARLRRSAVELSATIPAPAAGGRVGHRSTAEQLQDIVSSRARELERHERIAAVSEERTAQQLEEQRRQARSAAGSEGVSTRASSVGGSGSGYEGAAAEMLRRETDNTAREAAQLGANLVQREMEILRAEIERATTLQSSLLGEAASPRPATVNSRPADRPSAPGQPMREARVRSRSTSPAGQASLAPPPNLAAVRAERAGRPLSRDKSRSSDGRSGVVLGGRVDGGVAIPTPSLGSRQRTLRASSRSSAEERRATYSTIPDVGNSGPDVRVVRNPEFAGRVLAAEASAVISPSGHALHPRRQVQGISPPQRHSILRSHRRGGEDDDGGYTSGSSGSPLSQRPLDAE